MTIANRCLIFVAGFVLTASVAYAQQKPQPQPQLRGFGVVLLEGSQQPGATADLPQSASAALADIKDFLPFKSYQLLDSSWTLGSNAAQEYSTRLQGRGQQFQVKIGSKVDPASSSVDVKLTLREAQSLQQPQSDAAQTRALDEITKARLAREQASVTQLGAQLQALLAKRDASPQEVSALEAQLRASQARALSIVAQAPGSPVDWNLRQGTGRQTFLSHAGNPLIDASFTMRVGETVVVGTSRVGGDRALVVLLTAVPSSAKP